MDFLKDYKYQTIKLTPDYEGEVTSTLIASKSNKINRKSVLYIHGYNDYFFHSHLGEKFIENNYNFYAIDLRKYGRSLLPHQHPNYCKDIGEYFEEISIAILQIYTFSSEDIILLGHSTGGLIASSYMNYGKEKKLIKKLILNSPFLDFKNSTIEKFFATLVAKLLVGIFPYSRINGTIPPAYAQSLHKDFYGEWDFNIDWKPIKGFPTYFSWILAVSKYHKKMENSNINIPILVVHSNCSSNVSVFSKEAMFTDVILDVEDIKRVAIKLGNQVTLVEFENAQHDVFLSQKNVREKAIDMMFTWLNKVEIEN